MSRTKTFVRTSAPASQPTRAATDSYAHPLQHPCCRARVGKSVNRTATPATADTQSEKQLKSAQKENLEIQTWRLGLLETKSTEHMPLVWRHEHGSFEARPGLLLPSDAWHTRVTILWVPLDAGPPRDLHTMEPRNQLPRRSNSRVSQKR